jgi:hypothetical protein
LVVVAVECVVTSDPTGEAGALAGAHGKELGEMAPLAETIEASIHAPIETRCLSQFDEARGVEVGPEAVDPAASQASW